MHRTDPIGGYSRSGYALQSGGIYGDTHALLHLRDGEYPGQDSNLRMSACKTDAFGRLATRARGPKIVPPVGGGP